VIGGIYTLLCANYQAELATMLPKAGGPYVYAQRAYGDYGGFVVGWSDWLGNLTPLAYLPIALAEYMAALVPASAPYVKVVAISVLFLLASMNWLGLRFGSRAQKVMSFLKAVALFAFIIACFVFGDHKTNAVQTVPAPATLSALLVAGVLSFQLVIGTFGGWNSAIYFAEEDKDPSRNIPRSLFGGVLLVIGIYLLVNIALLYTLTISQMTASKLPAADAMQQIFGGSGGQIVTVIAVISLVAILNAVLMFIPRTLYALGRDRLFFSKAALVNKGGTPTVALSITFVAAVLLMLTGTFEQLFTIYAFYNVLGNILLILSLFILRKREPDLPRPYKTWGYPVTPFLLLLIAIALFVGFVVSDTTKSLQASATLVLSIPIYLLIKKYRRGPDS
jgi:APA family basic amino acid/polyamine antiporter